MPWITVAGSNIGAREEQQDRYLVVRNDDGTKQLLAVADGAGGHTMGALAAQTAISYIQKNLKNLWVSDDPQEFLNNLIFECNQKVLALSDDELACTTIVVVFMKSSELFWGHVGDSRFYLVRNGEVVAQTNDHSVVELQKKQGDHAIEGVIDAADNELYMCLGALADITPELDSSAAREGDSLMLCSDGLWGQTDMVKTVAELSETGLSKAGLSKMVEQGISAARASDLRNSDNITLIVSKYVGEPNIFRRALNTIFNLK